MSLDLEHVVVSARLEPTSEVEGEETVIRVAKQGTFDVIHPGVFRRFVRVSIPRHYRLPPDPNNPQYERPTNVIDGMDVGLTILSPDGKPFTADEVTIEDLRRFRDIRGVPQGKWSYTLGGEKRYNPHEETHETIGEPSGEVILWVVETVPSASAPPLIYRTPLDGSTQTFTFDLWRLGRLVAEIATTASWNGTTRLLDPDGVEVAATSSTKLAFDVDAASLRKSRDSGARPRSWSIEVRPQGGTVTGGSTISAHVFATSRVATSAISDRILKLLGDNGRFIEIFGRNKHGMAELRLIIDDDTAAAAFDTFHLLEKPLARYDQDPPLVATEIIRGAEYTLYSKDENRDYGIRVDVSSLRVTAIRVSVGGGVHLGSAVPTIRVEVDVTGEVVAELGGHAVGHGSVEDGSLEFEVGLSLGADGVPKFETWIRDDPIDGDVDMTALAAVGVLPLGVLVDVVAVTVVEIVEGRLNDELVHGLDFFFGHPELASRILMTIMGAHLTYTNIRMDGDNIVFDYIAPVEADPKPSPNYVGVVGREIEDFGDGRIRMRPRRLDDTWVADNLRSKIDHIVYVMMENRSYDHVLGYRALDPINEPSDGLTPALIAAIQGDPPAYSVRNLAQAQFPANQLGMMTRLPKGVGHSFKAVTKQLSVWVPGPSGQINGAEGFVQDFIPHIGDDDLNTPEDERMGVSPNDVLGYYDGVQLPMYEYLARNYAYLDRFFSSHPGPTLPNRMFALTGDLQYNRDGVPILENNHGDNVQLSRAQTIFDVLERRGVSWRVYESVPSVAMLRMFARYAGNAERIRPIETLESDLAQDGLPSFCVIEPAMHHHPQDDDHPDADMWRGQRFIRRVYQALRSLPTWNRTLLIITYDEHGGLYDHVIPPLAEIIDAGVTGSGASGLPPVLDVRNPDSGSGTGGSGSGASAGGGWAGRLGSNRFGPGDRGPTTVASGDETDPVPPPARRVDITYGVRVPTFIVSPWVPAGKGLSEVYDFCSILKTVLARFTDDQPFMSDRVRASRSLDANLSESAPRSVLEEPPEIAELESSVRRLAPDQSAIDTPPLSSRQMREGPVESHDVMGHIGRILGR